MRGIKARITHRVSPLFDAAHHWVERYERRLSSIALLSGFIFDYITLTRIDRLYDNLVIVFYLLVASTSITFIHLYESWTFHKYVRAGGRLDTLFGWVHLALPTILQFAFGGMFSAFVVFYSRSATLAGSWPFLLLLVGLMIGNEFFKRRYVRLTFQVSLLFFAIYSYMIFAVPILIGSISWWVFLLSGVATLTVILGFLYLLSRIIPTRFMQSQRHVLISIGVIFFAVNLFYTLNLIPPIPLSLQEAGVYHSVTRNAAGDYVAVRETREWYDYIRPKTIVHVAPNTTVYVFSSVFAPTDLRAEIVHAWQYYDTGKNKWITASRTRFPVIGGREAGFRGYSYKSDTFPGRWRVRIQTPDGRTIGQMAFTIEQVQEEPELEQVTL